MSNIDHSIQPSTKETEELDVCFGRLRVGQKQILLPKVTKKKIVKAKVSAARSKGTTRKLLRDPKLKLPDELTAKIHIRSAKQRSLESKNVENTVTAADVDSEYKQELKTELSGSENTLLEPVISCGMQHITSNTLSLPDMVRNTDDTSPEELAAYFDQLLHIPKPMSTMAEMMYA